jgi:hypothetical protein
MTPNAGYDAGIAKHKKKERLAWALKGAPVRSKDLRLTTIGALAEGRKLRDSITEKLDKSGINPEEGVVSIVLAEPDLSAITPKFPIIPHAPSWEIEIDIAEKFADKTPIGFLVFIWDKADQKIFGHARPLIVEDPRSLALNAQALRVFDRHLRRVVLGGRTHGQI